MPHQCTTCDRTFPDGSKEMLGGCPDCGGNKFQFLPESAVRDGAPGTSADRSTNDEILEAPPDPRDDAGRKTGAEDAAQASARRSVVSRDELPSVDDRAGVLEEIARDSQPAARTDTGGDAAPDDEGTGGRPDLAALRKELNDQFESIKILEPGQYELNLMELYDREEYIIALEEDGRYVIDVPTRWRDGEGLD